MLIAYNIKFYNILHLLTALKNIIAFFIVFVFKPPPVTDSGSL